jgi:hypothetical protein
VRFGLQFGRSIPEHDPEEARRRIDASRRRSGALARARHARMQIYRTWQLEAAAAAPETATLTEAERKRLAGLVRRAARDGRRA